MTRRCREKWSGVVGPEGNEDARCVLAAGHPGLHSLGIDSPDELGEGVPDER